MEFNSTGEWIQFMIEVTTINFTYGTNDAFKRKVLLSKFEYRNSKLETNPNIKFSNVQNKILG